MQKIRLITLFSGYDSQALSMERLKRDYPDKFDYELVAWCEIDKNACMAHDSLFPQWKDRNLGDISKVNTEDIPDCDCMTWSFPCTDISGAGRQMGLSKESGTRSSLAWEAILCFKSKRPKYLLMENVSALAQKKFIKDFHALQYELEELGYTNFCAILDSSKFGVPQHRERLFMVSIRDCDRTYHFPEPFKLEKRIKDYLEPYGSVPESFYLTPKHLYNVIAHCEKKQKEGCGFRTKFEDENGICGTILTAYGNRPTDAYIKEPAILGYTRSRDGKITSVHLKDTANTIHTFTGSGFTTDQYVAESALFNPMPDGTCRTLKAQYARIDACNHYRLFEKVPTEGQYSTPDNIVLVDEDGKGYLLKDGWIWRVRKLTPLETFRLQGVSDEDAKKIIATVSKSACYSLAGNSITVDVIQKIFFKLFIDKKDDSRQPSLFDI